MSNPFKMSMASCITGISEMEPIIMAILLMFCCFVI